jgi:hypothetical protein
MGCEKLVFRNDRIWHFCMDRPRVARCNRPMTNLTVAMIFCAVYALLPPLCDGVRVLDLQAGDSYGTTQPVIREYIYDRSECEAIPKDSIINLKCEDPG